MQGDFFQVLRRVQKEERNKSSLARVENDFYKQLRDYIRDLERSVANDPFGNEQLLLNNAQRIATEICELREFKITKAANNNIYRSFLLFKKDNPQFDLLDTTPLNLTDEEETLYFSLMDALKNHRYRISLDEYTEESTVDEDYKDEYVEDYGEDYDEDEETSFVEDSYESGESPEVESSIGDDLEEEISDTLGESDESLENLSSDALGGAGESLVDEVSDTISESDGVLNRLNQIKDAKVITDEKYENIDKQVANQRYPSQGSQEDIQEDSSDVYIEDESQFDFQADSQETKEESKFTEESSKSESFVSDNIDDIFKDPDSQFVDINKVEPNYGDDFYQAIAAESNYAQPTEDDFNMIFAKPKGSKLDAETAKPKESKVGDVETAKPKVEDHSELKDSNLEVPSKPKSTQSELGFSSGLDVKEKKVSHDGWDRAVQKSDEIPKKPVDKTRGGVFAKDEIENATVVISENIGEMVGIDGKVYGPFLENDVVILPNITAQILIDNNKAHIVKY